MLSPRFFVLAGLFTFCATGACGSEKTVPDHITAQIAPAKTSIYVGSVTLTVAPLTRQGASYASTYTASVFPYFFFTEAGTFQIEVSDADLFRLASGQSIDFTGLAVRADGVVRPLACHADPHSLADGRVKVRVYVSKRLILVFNTTYHISGWQN
jgi:hypothetical protein